VGTVSGETDLARLLAGMRPELDADIAWTFCACGDAVPRELNAIATFREDEGWTAIARLEDALATGVRHEGTFARVTLAVHSSLAAVGFLAAVAQALAGRGIACNAVSAFHHDHLFVPIERAEETMAVLAAMQQASQGAD
jgi:hypothetical protein